MRVLTASDHALLVETADLAEAMRLHHAAASLRGVLERVPGARSVLLRFDPLQVAAGDLVDAVQGLRLDAAPVTADREVTIPVHYDGEDLDEVAVLLGVSVEELVNRHLAADWQVAFSGFAPGFGYIVGDDPIFDVPRRSSPRTRVPPGAVALAGPFTGVYPRQSPGGWQLVGRTEAVLWDIDRDPPALLSPGTHVRFVRAQRDGPDRAAARVLSSARAEPPGEPRHPPLRASAVEVVRPAVQMLVQDRGRPGHAALGVSASGAADRTALRDANRAVGNARGAAALEIVGAAVLRFHGAGVAAVAGAIGDLSLTGSGDVESVVEHGAPFAFFDGDELVLGAPMNGLRYVVAVRGGIRARPVLGSRSADTLAGLGPAPLRAGDVVEVGTDAAGAVDPCAVTRPLPASGDLVELTITVGPRDDWFTPDALRILTAQEWEVTQRSDRIGIRLQGEVPLERAVDGELPSEGAVTGAIQVPPDGQPVLFLPDHPITGGYPIIGALTADALDLAGQLPPGARVRFRRRTG